MAYSSVVVRVGFEGLRKSRGFDRARSGLASALQKGKELQHMLRVGFKFVKLSVRDSKFYLALSNIRLIVRKFYMTYQALYLRI